MNGEKALANSNFTTSMNTSSEAKNDNKNKKTERTKASYCIMKKG